MTSSTTTLDAASVRARHRRMLIKLLWQEGRISRAEVARRTGLSRSTVSAITSGLLETNLVRELGSGTSRGGRRPIVLGFDHNARLVVGVDVGASHVAVGLINLCGQVRVWRRQALAVRDDPEGTIALATRLTQDVMREEPGSSERTIGIGLSMPSPIVQGEPNRLSSLLLPRWAGHDITDAFRRRFGLPVYLENDANAGALAELRWGAGRGRDNLAYVKIATGIGVGMIVNGELYRGARGVAGEISHLSIDADGPRCVCGQRGCLVLYGGSGAILARAAERMGRKAGNGTAGAPDTGAPGTESIVDAPGTEGVADAPGTKGIVDAPGTEGIVDARGTEGVVDAPGTEGIVDAALAGDRLAMDLLHQAGRHLGVGVANLINLTDPGLVVLAGDLTRAGRILIDPIDAAVRARVLSIAAVPPEIITSSLGPRGVALGAATLVIDDVLENDHLLLAPRSGTAATY